MQRQKQTNKQQTKAKTKKVADIIFLSFTTRITPHGGDIYSALGNNIQYVSLF